MARVVFPQEAIVQYVNGILRIGGLAIRDGTTLTRQASSLMNKPHHGRVLANLRTYANEREQYGADEVREIVADMETFMDPKIVEHKKKIEAGRAARAEERQEKKEAEEIAAWEPGGKYWTEALDQMVADAHWLIYAVKNIRDSDDERLVEAMREYRNSEERTRLFSGLLEALKPPAPALAPPVPAKRCSRRRRGGRDDKVVRLFNDT